MQHRVSMYFEVQFRWVGFRVVCFLYKTDPNPNPKFIAVGKSAPSATFHLIFLGLGWPWVGEFAGSIIIFICFPTQQSLVNRKHALCTYHARQGAVVAM